MEFAEKLLETAATGSPEKVLECAFRETGLATNLCDNAFALIAEVGMDLLPEKISRPADNDRKEQIEWHNAMARAEGPLIDDRSGNPFRAMCTDVVFRGEHIAKLSFFENRPFSEEKDKRILTLTAAALAGILMDDSGVQRLSDDPAASFLQSLLDNRVSGNSMERANISFRLGRIREWRIAAVTVGANGVPDEKQTSRLLKGLSLSFHTVYEKKLCILFPKEAEEQLLLNLNSANASYMGLSRCFTDIRFTSEHWSQASYAHNAAVLSGEPYASYDRLFLKEAAELLMKRKGGPERIRPELIALDAYDAEHGTSLVKTLRTYLEMDRNLADTASALYIHYNTVKYRMGMIREVSGLQKIDTSTAAELLLSFEMYSLYAKQRK